MEFLVGDKKFTDYAEALKYEESLKATDYMERLLNCTGCYEVTYTDVERRVLVFCSSDDVGGVSDLFSAFKEGVCGREYTTNMDTAEFTRNYSVNKLSRNVFTAYYAQYLASEPSVKKGVVYKDFGNLRIVWVNGASFAPKAAADEGCFIHITAFRG